MDLAGFREAIRDWAELNEESITDAQADVALRRAFATVVGAAEWPWTRTRIVDLSVDDLADFDSLQQIESITDTDPDAPIVLQQVSSVEGRQFSGPPAGWSLDGAGATGLLSIRIWPEPETTDEDRFEAVGPINGQPWPQADTGRTESPKVAAASGSPSASVPGWLHTAILEYAHHAIAIAKGDARLAREHALAGRELVSDAISRFGGADPSDTAYAGDAAQTVFVPVAGVPFLG